MTRFAVIPLFGNRVAPRCNCTADFLLVRIQNSDIVSRETIHLNCEEESDWLESLIDIGIDVFVCGGIEREHHRRLEAGGIQVISNVAAEVNEILPSLAKNQLQSWYGYQGIETTGRPAVLSIGEVRQDERTAPCLINCLQCDDRSCLIGKGCVVQTDGEFAPTCNLSHDQNYTFYLTSLAGAPISRMEDIDAYCRSLHCKRLGIVFCTAVFSEIDWILELLEDSIQTLPVCCQFGRSRDENRTANGQPLCDPNTLVSILNDAGCDLVVSIGPCSRFNETLDRHSRAPVIAAIAKDRRAGGNLFPNAETCSERDAWRKEKVC